MSYSILLFDKMIELNERVKLSVKRRDALKTIPLKELGFISKSCILFDAIEQISKVCFIICT